MILMNKCGPFVGEYVAKYFYTFSPHYNMIVTSYTTKQVGEILACYISKQLIIKCR